MDDVQNAYYVQQGWRNREEPRGLIYRAQKFHLLGGTEGDTVFFKMGPFDSHCAVFRQFAIVTYAWWALLALGALFLKGP